MHRGKVIGILVVLAVFIAAVTPAGAASQGGLGAPADVDPDAVKIAIDVQPDGTAEWQIQYRVRLSTDNETAAYEDIVADVEEDPTPYVDRFAERINGTVATAENQTGRQMRASDFAMSASIRELPQTYGTMTYTFTWHGFAPTDGETVRVGDSLRGFFLDSETSMMVTWPDSYTATTVEPTPTDRRAQAITWAGPLEFATGEPLVVIEPGEATSTTVETTRNGAPMGSDTALFLLAGVFVVLIALVFIVVWYLRATQDGDGGGAPPTASGDVSGGGAAAAPAEPSPEETEPPDELLSNEERVTRFVRDHGGRAKQQEIVDGLEWTEAKTSQVLSTMADEGSIEKFRIGRENVVKLPEEGEDL